MHEDENIKSYVHRVDELVGGIQGLGAMVDESRIVKKIHRTLPDAYSEKVSAIEEFVDYKTYTKDQLLGTLTSFEMRNPSLRSRSKTTKFLFGLQKLKIHMKKTSMKQKLTL